MVYQKNILSCVVRAGERCRYGIGEGSHYEFMNCVEYADCDPTLHICKCPEGFYESNEGYCRQLKGYSGGCNSTTECRAPLQCLTTTNQCDCDPETSRYQDNYYSPFQYGQYSGTCVGIMGKPCINSLCSEDSQCLQTSSGSKCTCNDSFYESDGKCFREYGNTCSTKEMEQCGPDFNCVDGTCKCKYSGNQVHDEGLRKCVSTAYGPCEDSKCVHNSECIEVDGYKQCRCRTGYIDVDGLCDRDHGSSCENIEVSIFIYQQRPGVSSTFREGCDRKVPLHCVNGICNCEDAGTVYDQRQRKCVWLVGYKCEAGDTCVENAICLKDQQAPLAKPAQCACMDEYIVTTNRTCVKDTSFVDDEFAP